MSKRLQGHRTKLNANKMACDGRCSSRRKQPVFSSFSRTVQSSGVAWTWAATLTLYEIWQTVLFHTSAAATGKARSPTVDSRDGGTTKAGVDAERVVSNQIKKSLLMRLSVIFLNRWIFGKVTIENMVISCTFFQSWGLESVSSLCFWDLRLDLRLEHKDLRLTRDSTSKTRDLLATRKSLCYSRVVIKDEFGKRQKISTRFLLYHVAPLF